MRLEIWSECIKIAAFIGGLGIGTFAVGSPAWVWLKKQKLSNQACWLATVGALLVSMSIWQSVEIEGPGFKAQIAELQSQNNQMRVALDGIRSSTEAIIARSWNVQRIKISEGDNVTNMLKRVGVEDRHLDEILHSLQGAYEPDNLKARQELDVTAAKHKDQSARLLSVAFDPESDHEILVTWETEDQLNLESGVRYRPASKPWTATISSIRLPVGVRRIWMTKSTAVPINR